MSIIPGICPLSPVSYTHLLIESSVKAVEKGMVIAGKTASQLEAVAGNSKTITDEVNGIAETLETVSYTHLDVYKRQVYDGSYHEVDSSEMAFHIAGSMCFKEAMAKAAPRCV